MEDNEKHLKNFMKNVDQEAHVPMSDFAWTSEVMKRVRTSAELKVKPLQFPFVPVLVFSVFVVLMAMYFWQTEMYSSFIEISVPELLPDLPMVYWSLVILALGIAVVFYRQIKRLHANDMN